jgi:hypothetical protein
MLDIFWAGPPALACTSFGFLINNNSREREKKTKYNGILSEQRFSCKAISPITHQTEMFERRTIDLPSSAHQELNVEEVCNILIIHWIFIVQLSALCVAGGRDSRRSFYLHDVRLGGGAVI